MEMTSSMMETSSRSMERLSNQHLAVDPDYNSSRRGSGSTKSIRKLLAGLRVSKSSEELYKGGRTDSPRGSKKGFSHADDTVVSSGWHQNGDFIVAGGSPGRPCRRKLQLGATLSNSSTLVNQQVALPQIQVTSYTWSPTSSPSTPHRQGRLNMKKSLQDTKSSHKRRKSPLSTKRSGHGEAGAGAGAGGGNGTGGGGGGSGPGAGGGGPSGVLSSAASSSGSMPRGLGLRTVATADGSLLSEGQQSHDESETTEGSCSTLPLAANGGSASDATTGDLGEDFHDGGRDTDYERKKTLIHELNAKIARVMDQIKVEQKAKEDAVNEYLRLSDKQSADKQQIQRIKTVFEKKNQKSTQAIYHLQKKLENYHKRLKEVETHGVSSHRLPKEVLKDMGQGLKGFFARDTSYSTPRSRDSSPAGQRDVGTNIREGLTGLSAGGIAENIKESIVSKPKEFLSAHLTKNKYGSADNIHHLSRQHDESQGSTDENDKHSHPGSSTMPSRLPGNPATNVSEEDVAGSSMTSESPSANSSPYPTLPPASQGIPLETQLEHFLEPLRKDLQYLTDSTRRLQHDVTDLKTDLKDGLTQLSHALEEEKERRERLEEQINDLTELHQNEMTNIKQELTSMEEKMEYQLDERTSDMQDLLEQCHTKITKMEVHQQQENQLISMEGIENSNFRALIVKLLNVVLALIGVVLVFVSTLANLLGPFLTTRLRILSTVALIALIVATWQNWPTVREYGHHVYERYGYLLPAR